MGMKMGNFLKSLGFLVLLALGLNVFNVSADVAWDTILSAFDGELQWSTALYTVVCAVGVAMVTLQIWVWFSTFSAKLHGKPVLDAYHKQVEADWADTRKAIEGKLIECASSNDKYREENRLVNEELGRVRNDLHRARATGRKLEEELNEAKDELKVLRGPLELAPVTAGCANVSAMHFDDWALDQFTLQMRATLKRKRDEGSTGWNLAEECSLEELVSSASYHMDAGKDVHAANYLMMHWVRNAFPEECLKADPNA